MTLPNDSYAECIRTARASAKQSRVAADAWRRLAPDEINPTAFAVLRLGVVEYMESIARSQEANADALERAEKKIRRLRSGRTNR